MSTCKSSNCHLKNFNGCVSNDICEVSGISGTERQAICQPKNNVPDSFYRTDQECENVVSPYSQNPQYDCEEKVGCEWGYSRTITNKILQKKCIPTTVNYSCSSVVRDWSITDLSRYSSQEKETHGCPSDKCDYTPNQKIRNPGSCSGTTASACEDLTKNECIINQECSWSSNDEFNQILRDTKMKRRIKRSKGDILYQYECLIPNRFTILNIYKHNLVNLFNLNSLTA